MRTLFWLAVFGCVYSYALYPLLLRLVPARQPVRGSPAYMPAVSLIIACRNEARRLRHKLDNALDLDYPDLEIIVCSDASDDGSDAIVAEYAPRGVKLVRSGERRGKEFAQGLAIAASRGEILVFSDAGTDLPAGSIRVLVEDLSDPSVGAVSSEDRFISTDGSVVGYVVSSGCAYHAPITYPEPIEAGLRVDRLGNSSVQYGIAIFRAGGQEAVAHGHFIHVFVEREHDRSVPIPANLRTALARIQQPPGENSSSS